VKKIKSFFFKGMAYCLIAQVPPIYGLYTSFFPALMYTFLGSGMHSAFGPFAIVSGVMTGDIVVSVMHELGKDPSKTRFDTISGNDILYKGMTSTTKASISDEFPDLRNIDIAIMVAFIIGAYILVFGILQLGFISNFMSEELISGFTTSVSILVFVSQLRHLLGVDFGHFSGPFSLYYTLYDVFEKIKFVNLTTLTISGICLATLLVFKLIVNPFTRSHGIKTPIPIELFVMIGGTVASHYLDLKSGPYYVKIVDTIGNKYLIFKKFLDTF
jgi:MFS superfamily sulfate permease-like transporter